jgi:hypothetical protein
VASHSVAAVSVRKSRINRRCEINAKWSDARYRILNTRDEIYAAHPVETRIKQEKKKNKCTHASPVLFSMHSPDARFASRCNTMPSRVGSTGSAKPSTACACYGFANCHETVEYKCKIGSSSRRTQCGEREKAESIKRRECIHRERAGTNGSSGGGERKEKCSRLWM